MGLDRVDLKMLEKEAMQSGDFLISNTLPFSKMQKISDTGMPRQDWCTCNSTLTPKVQGALWKGQKVGNLQKTMFSLRDTST